MEGFFGDRIRGRRLESLVREILPSHTKILEPVHRRIEIPYEQEVFTGLNGHDETYPSGDKRKSIMARFYEELTRGLYGGELRDKEYFWKFGNLIRPDVYDAENNIGYEVKTNVSSQSLNLGEMQFKGYQLGQFLDPKMRLYYVIPRHGLKRIASNKKEYRRYGNEVLEELFTSTFCFITLPMSMVIDISRNPKLRNSKNSFLYLYSNEDSAYNDCICFRSPTTNRLLVEPEKVLEEMDLDPSRFEFTRYLSPSNIRVNGRAVGYSRRDGSLSRFPIMHITEKYHEEWVKGFSEWYAEKFEIESIQLPLEEQPMFTTEEVSVKKDEPKNQKVPAAIPYSEDDDLPF